MKKITPLFILFLLIQTVGFSQKFEMSAPDLKFEIKQIAVIGEQLRINFMVTNVGNDKEIFFRGTAEISLFDDQGNAHKADYISFSGSRGSKMLIRGIPTKGQIVFSGAASTRKLISMLELKFDFGNTDLKMQFRDLPIPYQFGISSNPKVRTIEEDCFLEITGITYDGKNVIVNTVITNKGDDAEMDIKFNGRIIDNNSNEISCDGGTVGESKSGGSIVSKKFIQEVPIKASFLYPTPSKPSTLALLELFINDNKFIFKNLDVR